MRRGRDPRVNGWTLGFKERTSHGLRIIWHGGGTRRFSTVLALIPSEGLGIFVSYNTRSPRRLPEQLFSAILDHYYPAPPRFTPGEPAPGWEQRARAYSGTYAPLRRSYTTLQKLSGSGRGVSVVTVSPGEILVRSGTSADRLYEVEPGYFLPIDHSVSAAFREPRRGATHLYLSTSPDATLDRLRLWQQAEVHRVVTIVCLLVFASMIILTPARFVIQRRGARIGPPRRGERTLRWAALGFALLGITFYVALRTTLSDGDGFATGASEASIRRVLTLPLLSLPLAAAVVAGAALAFRREYWSRWERIHYAFVAVAVVVFFLQLHYLRIPAHHEQPFRSKVNTDSDRW